MFPSPSKFTTSIGPLVLLFLYVYSSIPHFCFIEILQCCPWDFWNLFLFLNHSKWMISESPCVQPRTWQISRKQIIKHCLSPNWKPNFFQNDYSQSGWMQSPADQSFSGAGSHAGYLQVSVSFVKMSLSHFSGRDHTSQFPQNSLSLCLLFWYDYSLCIVSLSKVSQFGW